MNCSLQINDQNRDIYHNSFLTKNESRETRFSWIYDILENYNKPEFEFDIYQTQTQTTNALNYNISKFQNNKIKTAFFMKNQS